ncbi:MAG: molybdopterin-dependent oxidoreductase [Kiritimatiellae bacterium]|nr:molybdopterin-dependent oxidoreductase [Kiritimatiellia bacterium]
MRSPDDTSEITRAEDLFTYHIFGIPDECRRYGEEDASAYRLTIDGLVDRPLSLSLPQIRDEFDRTERAMVLQCMTNVHWGRVRFAGARLGDVLKHAGCQAPAIKLALHCADGFTGDLTVAEVFENPDAHLLAFEMNGHPLPLEHGFPIRLTSDGRYGYKWPKWLQRIELVAHDFKGHYEGRRGWSDRGRRGERVV